MRREQVAEERGKHAQPKRTSSVLHGVTLEHCHPVSSTGWAPVYLPSGRREFKPWLNHYSFLRSIKKREESTGWLITCARVLEISPFALIGACYEGCPYDCINPVKIAFYFSERRSAVYSLYAVSNHSGSTYGGHYTAYCKHPVSNDWHCFNDSR